MLDLLDSQIVWTVAIAWVITHTIKFITNTIKEDDVELDNFFSTGGFPSGHTTLVTALTLCVAFQEGWGSVLTSITAMFAFIVIFDALSIRYQAGLHAQVLNAITNPQTVIGKKLKVNLGHTFKEVSGGFLVALIVSYVSYFILS